MKIKFNHDLANQNRPVKKFMRWDIINACVKKIKAKKYLEIGYCKGETFNNVKCELKFSVDPCLRQTETMFSMTSDEFFMQNEEIFDLIFIDGNHSEAYVERDILNALHCISNNGIICVHDLNPWNEYVQSSNSMLGDGWKAWVKLRCSRKDLRMIVVNDDSGVGVIQSGSQEVINIDQELTYENLDKNRNEWLNLISVEDFKNKFSK